MGARREAEDAGLDRQYSIGIETAKDTGRNRERNKEKERNRHEEKARHRRKNCGSGSK